MSDTIMTTEKPLHRRHSLELQIHADDWPELLFMLEDFVAEIKGGLNNLVRASPCSAGHFSVVEDPAMTRERYVRLLEERIAIESNQVPNPADDSVPSTRAPDMAA